MQRELIGRALTPAERAEVVDTLVRQEILVREASARGLHLLDSKTRERLVTQMYFVMTEDAPDPSPEDLKALKDANPEQYMYPESVSFDHVFFETDRDAALALMQKIDAGVALPEGAGDRFWLGSRLEYYTPAQVETVLGADFGAALTELEPGMWTGPIRSGRGWHLVRLEAFYPQQPLAADTLDQKLREDWIQFYRERSFGNRLADMRASYTIVLPSEEEVAATKPQLLTAQSESGDGEAE